MQPAVSVIVVNWNGKHILPDCLDSLRRQTFNHIGLVEVIVVDNGSTDGSFEYIKDYVPKVRLIKNPRNVGFAEANNQGILIAKGKYIAILNNDARAGKDWLVELVAAAEKHPGTGMFASKILLPNGKIDSAGCTVYPDGIGICRGRGEDGGQYDHQDYVTFPSGCAALYRKEMLKEIGVFDANFFMYCEDTDLGLRAQKAGWKCLYVPTAKVEHLYSQSAGAYSLKKLFYVERNRLYLAMKNFTLKQFIFSIPCTLLRYFKMLTRGMAWSE